MKIRVDKDNLRIIELSQLESGEVNSTQVEFIFTPEYEDLIKTAVFTLGDKSYKVILQNDKCFVPQEVLVEGNKITIGVYAFKVEGEDLKLRYSPVPVTAEILKGSYVEEAENTSHPTPTEIEQLMELISKNTSDIESLDNRVTTLENKEGSCETQIENIKEDLIDIKADIQDLEDNVTTINNSITDIEGDIDDIEGDIVDINGDISDINTSITNINQLDERQNRRLNSIDNFIRQWPKTEYQTGTNINLGKTIQAVVQYEDDKVLYGNAEQEGTPTPTEPIPISVVTGEQSVVVHGKNCFNPNNITFTNGILDDNGQPSSSSASHYTNNFWRVEPSTNYALSGTLRTENIGYRVYYYDKNKNWLSRTVNINTTSYTFTTTSNCYYIRLQVANEITLQDIQLELGTSVTSYTPYTSTTTTIDLKTLELAKIGTYQDYIYFDVDEGKWYKKGLINKTTFNGEETWFIASSIATNTSRFWTQKNSIINTAISGDTNIYIKSPKFIGITWNEMYQTDTTTLNAISNYNSSSTTDGRCHIRIQNSIASTESAFTTWLSNNNLDIYYVLKTPTDEEITDTTLIQDLYNILAMMSVNGTTIIEVSGNLPAPIKVRAIKGE